MEAILILGTIVTAGAIVFFVLFVQERMRRIRAQEETARCKRQIEKLEEAQQSAIRRTKERDEKSFSEGREPRREFEKRPLQ